MPLFSLAPVNAVVYINHTVYGDKQMTADAKAARVLSDALDAIEDFAGRYDHESEDHRLMLVQLLAGLSLANVLERRGVWRMLRTTLASVFIAIRYRGLVRP
jgi:hypothetical protein